MQKFLRKVFTNDKVFSISTALAIITLLLSCIYFVESKTYVNIFYNIFTVVAFFLIYFSYRQHDKNVMKGAIGLAFGLILSYMASCFISYIATMENQPYLPFSVASAPLYLAVTVLHFVVNSDHHSSPKLVLTNQILLLVIIAVSIILPFGYNTEQYTSSAYSAFLLLCCTYGFVFAAISILCVETKLDSFRIEREKKAENESSEEV